MRWLLTIASFWAASTDLVFPPGVPLRWVCWPSRRGEPVHLVFFLTSPARLTRTTMSCIGIGVFHVAIVFGSMINHGQPEHNMMMPME